MYFLIFFFFYYIFSVWQFSFGLVRDDWSPCVAIGRLSAARDIARMGEAWKFVRLRRWWCRRFYIFSFSFFFFLCFGSCVSRCRRRRRHSVSSLGPSRRALARSLLSTVTGDDKMMESMSNAVAILLVTGGAFREPSCRALLRSTFPRHSSTPARLYSTLLSLSIPTLPLNPLYNSAQQYYDDSFFSIYSSFLFSFDYFYFLFPRSLSVTRPVRSTLVKLFAAPVSTFWWELFTYLLATTATNGSSTCLFHPHFHVIFSLLFFFFVLFFFIFDRVCVRSHFFTFYI